MPFQKGNTLGRFNKSKTGRKDSLETLKRKSKALLGNKNAFRKGKPKCIDCKKVLDLYTAKRCRKCCGISMRGENHFNWKGGISKNFHSPAEPKYREWRGKVFERDNWTCQTCGKRGCYLEAHHIKRWSDYPDLRYVLENGVTLCLQCHKLTDNYKNKKTKK